MYRLTQKGQRLTLAFYLELKSLQEIHPQTLKDSTMNWESTRNTPHTRNSHCSSCWTSCFITGRCVYNSIWPAGRAPECSNWLLQHIHTWDAPSYCSTCTHGMLLVPAAHVHTGCCRDGEKGKGDTALWRMPSVCEVLGSISGTEERRKSDPAATSRSFCLSCLWCWGLKCSLE